MLVMVAGQQIAALPPQGMLALMYAGKCRAGLDICHLCRLSIKTGLG